MIIACRAIEIIIKELTRELTRKLPRKLPQMPTNCIGIRKHESIK